MTYYSDYNHGAVANGSHLTGELEFYKVSTLVPLVGAEAEVNSANPGAADNLRMLVDVLSQHGQPVIQSVAVAENVALAGLGFGSNHAGNANVYTYKFSVEQPCAWGVDADVTVANIVAALDNVPAVYVAAGSEDTLNKFYTADAEKKNVVVEYAKVF